MCSLEFYFGVYFPRCCATREMNTKITIPWAHKQFAMRVHTLFYISTLFLQIWNVDMTYLDVIMGNSCPHNRPFVGVFLLSPQRPVMRICRVLCVVHMNNLLTKCSSCPWLDTLRHAWDDIVMQKLIDCKRHEIWFILTVASKNAIRSKQCCSTSLAGRMSWIWYAHIGITILNLKSCETCLKYYLLIPTQLTIVCFGWHLFPKPNIINIKNTKF